MALLFINQTEKSILRCNIAVNAASRRQINQHVQKRRQRRRREITKKNIPLGWLRDKSYDECLPTATHSEPSAEDDRIISQPLSPLPPYTSSHVAKRRPSFDLSESICAVQVDLEFFGIQAGSREHVSRLMDYYIQVFGPTYVWPPDMVPFGSIATFQQHFF